MKHISSIQSTTAAILVGGLGTRLRPVIDDRPKALAEVGDRPFVFLLLEQLYRAGIDHVVMLTGYRAEQVEAMVGYQYRTMTISYSREQRPAGTAGALRQAMPLLASDPVLVLNGDSFVDANLIGMLSWHSASRAAGTILLREVSDMRRFGRVVVQQTGEIGAFCEKDEAAQGPGLVNAGVYLLSQRLLQSIDENAFSLERDVFPRWACRGLRSFRAEGRFVDIGTPESLAYAQRLFSGAQR